MPKSNWAGVLDATKDGSPCVQGANPIVGSEDCLFVNVYTTGVSSYGDCAFASFCDYIIAYWLIGTYKVFPTKVTQWPVKATEHHF